MVRTTVAIIRIIIIVITAVIVVVITTVVITVITTAIVVEMVAIVAVINSSNSIITVITVGSRQASCCRNVDMRSQHLQRFRDSVKDVQVIDLHQLAYIHAFL